jgi:hypothetical protein
VVAHGVGTVARSIVAPTTTLRRVRSFLQQKTITHHPVVAPRKDSKKKTIALEAIQDIALKDGYKPL